MIKTPKKWLFDVVYFGEKISQYLLETTHFEAFSKDEKTRLAMERCIEIIGEACHKLRKNHQIIFTDSDRVYNFRGSLAHQYDEMRSETLFHFAAKVVPGLVSEAAILLENWEDLSA